VSIVLRGTNTQIAPSSDKDMQVPQKTPHSLTRAIKASPYGKTSHNYTTLQNQHKPPIASTNRSSLRLKNQIGQQNRKVSYNPPKKPSPTPPAVMPDKKNCAKHTNRSRETKRAMFLAGQRKSLLAASSATPPQKILVR